MNKYRFIAEFDEVVEKTLTDCFLYHKNGNCRIRAHALILSSKKYTIQEIADIFSVDRDTVSTWLNCWETYGLAGVYDDPHSGRPPKLGEAEEEFILKALEDNPRGIKVIAAGLKEQFGKEVHPITIKRFLKGIGKTWKRIRASLKDKRNKEEFKEYGGRVCQDHFSLKSGLHPKRWTQKDEI